MEQSKEVQLAYEIAHSLNDLNSIDWHISICKKYDEATLRDKLRYVLSRKDIGNPAGYYNKLIMIYGKHPRR